MKTIDTILKEYYGYDTFRPGQKELIQSLMNGQDVLVFMPIGGGKTLR